jgi:uncharacterized membrane protein
MSGAHRHLHDAVADLPAQILRKRIAVIDVMRGLIMMIMMFDHVRETIYLHMQVSDPMDVSSTAPALFFTRLAAHFCAPMFVFLTGLSAWLYAHPAAGPRDATGFLVKRGLLLIVLEIVVVSFAWSGQFPPAVIYLQVIWIFGLVMIILALLHRLPIWILATLGLTIVFGHNLLTPISFAPGSAGYIPWTILHDRGFLIAEGALKVKISYPLLPWIGVILLGYVAGPLYAQSFDPARRQRLLMRMGLGCLALLALLRGFNIYGETLPWVQGETFVHSMMSFFNFTKYPPSLSFLLLTIGGGMLVLSQLERFENRFTRISATFGGAPMFYYLLHLYILLLLQNVLVLIFGANHGSRFGVDHIWIVWLSSLAMLPVLYFPCRAFARFKRRTDQTWVRYF